MRILYWDAFAGISGDMALGSLIALGADQNEIIKQLHSIGLTEFELIVNSRHIQGIHAIDIEVNTILLEKHRHLGEIEEMIASGELSAKAKNNAKEVFRALAEAEARVHGTTIEEVHFHEVGAVDSLVDIIGTCIALDHLEVNEILVSVLPWSTGFVECAHGILPLPAPASVELLRGFRWRDSGVTGELVTPTGAALIRALAKQSIFPEMTLLKAGYGAGKNSYGIPSLLRAVIGDKT
ncbi:MAG: nickel pincer cofactor biosynthesis protein LarC [Desulfitobacteriaceae bacterium]